MHPLSLPVARQHRVWDPFVSLRAVWSVPLAVSCISLCECNSAGDLGQSCPLRSRWLPGPHVLFQAPPSPGLRPLPQLFQAVA